MLRRWWLSGAAGLMLAASVLLAKPGVVLTRDGHTFQGDVTEDDQFVTITIHGIATKIDKRNVAKIDYLATVDDQYKDRHDKLAADDVKGRMDLAKWAIENQRPDLAVATLEEARKIDPTNRDAAVALDDAQSQWDLDRRKKGQATATTGAASQPTTAEANAPKPPEYRLLTTNEINIIRQKELQSGDNVQIRFENNVVRKYLASGEHDSTAFYAMSPVDQALEIISSNNPKLAKDVLIATDPPPLLHFKQKVNPVVASSCASTACHGGGKNGGDFGLFTGDSNAAVYTNFYILQNYTKTIAGVKYRMLDRTIPDRSLLTQFMFPPDLTEIPHPQATSFRPRFHSKSDPVYVSMIDWLQNSLKPIAPDYGINVSAKVPATQPAK